MVHRMEEIEFSKPVHIQRLEQALKLEPFLNYVEHVINQPISDIDTASESETDGTISLKNGLNRTKEEQENDKSHLYNFDGVRRKRMWLKDVLVSSSDSETDGDEGEFTQEYLESMLREHRMRKHHQSHFYQNEENRGYLYYSAGLLSRVDKFPEHQRFMAGSIRKKNKEKREKEKLKKKLKKEEDEDDFDADSPLAQNEDSMHSFPDDASDDLTIPIKGRSRGSKKDKKPKKLDAQALALRRHKLWVLMAKKEVSRCQKSKASFRKEVLQNCKRIATGCMRVCRQKALQSQKTIKDKVWMLKRLTRTMQGEWKKFDRILKEQNRRAEREAEEQRKMDKEILEVKRQQRKVNFLITLPELYAHFMKNKMGSGSDDDDDTNLILKQLEDDGPMPSSSVDDYDCEAMKAQALKTAQEAYSNQQARLSQFSGDQDDFMPGLGCSREAKEHPQPIIFKGVLKSYQMKGMNWLANLYYFGINGILADEMGLGKTVQSIAFLAHICEQYDTWGPFLIITPASTLHNWTGEIARFVPGFQVVPYWGNPEERKNLRKFFDGKNLGTREASFHVVVTSYQIVIQDFKFLNRLKWNYMVLDEAQAIKSINSQRWKLLLGFSCRNRLLLSGTPIQNSMAELWALLHFIMPTLFDSHLWFNEWFSKDIEGHVENKTHVDEKHLNRLHMILKPFMLRRVKTEVENELTDKIEIMMYCPLTLRQKFLYNGLKNKISIDELLRSSMGPSSQQSSVTSSLMNLVMQFRKVCNHPELLERREVRSPFTMNPQLYVIPKLIFREANLLGASPSKHHLLYNKFSIFHPHHIHCSLVREGDQKRRCFSFLRFIDLSPQEMYEAALLDLRYRFLLLVAALQYAHIRTLRNQWTEKGQKRIPASKLSAGLKDQLLIDFNMSLPRICSSPVLSDLVFTSHTSSVYTFMDHVIHHIPETMNHRIMRSKKERPPLIEEISGTQMLLNDSEDQLGNLVKIEPDHIKLEPSDDITSPLSPETKLSSPEKAVSPHKSGGSHRAGSCHKSPHKRSGSGSKHSSRKHSVKKELIIGIKEELDAGNDALNLLPEFPHLERPPLVRSCQPTQLPFFLMHTCPKAQCLEKELYCHDRSAEWWRIRSHLSDTSDGLDCVLHGSAQLEKEWMLRKQKFTGLEVGGLRAGYPRLGWSRILIPDKHSLIMDAGKLYVLDTLLSQLKAGGHRVLIYSQMTKMIDLLEEYMWHRKHKYMRLDGSSKISDRRDMVADFQTKADIFVFLLSTRAGGVGINLTAADTVIFYDSDWNPTVDQQAMDRAHRLGQTKQVTVYRLVCKATIEERILQRAREKSEIQRMVISGGNFKPDTLKPKEVVSLLLDDDIEKQYRARQQERRMLEEHKIEVNREKMRERMRKRYAEKKLEKEQEEKRRRVEEGVVDVGGGGDSTPLNSTPASPTHSEVSLSTSLHLDEGSNDGSLIVDVESPSPATPVSFTGNVGGSTQSTSSGTPIRGQRKRGRPKGSTLRGRPSRSSEVSAVGSTSASASGSSSGIPVGASASSPGGSGSPSGNGSGSGGLPVKRGRGRPRLLPLGPGHQGTRTPPALPLALGTTLNTPKSDDTQKPFGYYT